jgi:ATP-dependent DNA ligase
MAFPTLYARSKTGKIKEWLVTVEGSTIIVMHGQQGGKMTPQITPITEGKNIGKSNETTPEQQAKLEAGSKWNHQIDKDYRERVEDIPTSTLPPLAKKYQDASAALGEEYDVLCKLNGVRCTLFYNGGDVFFQTRGGKSYPVIQGIVDELYEKVWRSWPHIAIDCELYCHGMFLEDITSAVKKHNKDTPRIKAYVFDLYNPTNPDQEWETRYSEYRCLIGDDDSNDRVHAVYAKRVYSEAEMKALHDKFVKMGYEGVVCRKLGSLFVFGHRTSDFQKYKVPLDKEFKVIRIDVDKNGCAVPWCYIENVKYPKRTEFKAPLIGTHEYQQEIARNAENYIGKYLKVVFESYTKYGIPGKPKGHVFREVDEDGNPTE